LNTVTSENVIASMDKMLVNHGLPLSINADNDPQFISEQFEEFLNENDIEHRRLTPRWPQSNGEVERQNRTLLKAMKIAQASGKDWKTELNKFLIVYRTTPR
jgi:transposase InsO family protein